MESFICLIFMSNINKPGYVPCQYCSGWKWHKQEYPSCYDCKEKVVTERIKKEFKQEKLNLEGGENNKAEL